MDSATMAPCFQEGSLKVGQASSEGCLGSTAGGHDGKPMLQMWGKRGLAVSAPSLIHCGAHRKALLSILLGQGLVMAQGKTQPYWGIKLVVDAIFPWVKDYWSDVEYDHVSSESFFPSYVFFEECLQGCSSPL